MLWISIGKLFFKGVYIYGHIETICKQKGPGNKKKELHKNSNSNIFQRKYENFNCLTVSAINRFDLP